MPNIVTELIVDRVDLVEEGANSAAFIEIYKRRETKGNMTVEEILSQMKPEHAEVIKSKLTEGDTATASLVEVNNELAKTKEDLVAANEELAKAKEEIEKAKTCKSCGAKLDDKGKCPNGCDAKEDTSKSSSLDETEVLKGLDPKVAEIFKTMKAQKEAAEEVVKKATEEKEKAEAVAKAATLKSLPVDQETLVDVLKGASQEVVDLLTTVNNAIDATVLTEVGKSVDNKNTAGDPDSAWAQIDKAAETIEKSAGITHQAAIARVIKEQPDLYKNYLNGGAN